MYLTRCQKTQKKCLKLDSVIFSWISLYNIGYPAYLKHNPHFLKNNAVKSTSIVLDPWILNSFFKKLCISTWVYLHSWGGNVQKKQAAPFFLARFCHFHQNTFASRRCIDAIWALKVIYQRVFTTKPLEDKDIEAVLCLLRSWDSRKITI